MSFAWVNSFPFSLLASIVVTGGYTEAMEREHAPPHGPDIPPDLVIKNVRLALPDRLHNTELWTVVCHGGRVARVTPWILTDDEEQANLKIKVIDAKGGLMIPSLCHSHIHLDKCYLLSQCRLETGDFAEAMTVTAEAKARFQKEGEDGLYARGYRLVRESVASGVTAMRAHVEVDTMVEFRCLDVAQQLKREFEGICDIQISAFAQEALFSSDSEGPNENYRLLEKASRMPGVSVVGSAPYVESTIAASKKNIAFVIELGMSNGLNVDFHLDYNLDPEKEPMIYNVIDAIKEDHRWNSSSNPPRLTIGHATRLQLLTPAQWMDLAERVKNLPLSIVSLPQSDIYMMGRVTPQQEDTPASGAPRGTLRVTEIAENYGLEIAMSVNNIENAFTPQGSVDPLSLCMFGVAIFQTATPKDIETLLRSVTSTSKRALGMKDIQSDLVPALDDPADFVILHGISEARSAVLNPGYDRTTIRAGVVVSTRRSSSWMLGDS